MKMILSYEWFISQVGVNHVFLHDTLCFFCRNGTWCLDGLNYKGLFILHFPNHVCMLNKALYEYMVPKNNIGFL